MTTPTEIRQAIADAPDPVTGLDKALVLAGCWMPASHIAAAVEAIQEYGNGAITHVTRSHEPVRMWRDTQLQPVIARNLRDRALRKVDQEGKAFAGVPVQTVHRIHYEPDPQTITADDSPLTDEEINDLPVDAFIEVRITVPTRPLTGGTA